MGEIGRRLHAVGVAGRWTRLNSLQGRMANLVCAGFLLGFAVQEVVAESLGIGGSSQRFHSREFGSLADGVSLGKDL